MDASRLGASERPVFRAESADDLRDLITQAELIVANLRGAGARAQTLLFLLDTIEGFLGTLEETGIDLRAEATRVADVERSLQAKDGTLVREMQAVGGLPAAREAAKPDREQWWWFLDVRVAERHRGQMRRVLTIGGAVAAVLLVVTLAYQFLFPPDPRVTAAMDKTNAAEVALQEGDVAKALTLYKEAVEINPSDPESLVWVGILSEMQGDEAAAADAYQAAEALVDDPAKVVVTRGLAWLGLGQVDKADADAQTAVAAAPDFAEAYLLLGSVYEQKGDVPKAVDALEKASDLASEAGDSALVVVIRMRLGMLLQSAPMGSGSPQAPTLTPVP